MKISRNVIQLFFFLFCCHAAIAQNLCDSAIQELGNVSKKYGDAQERSGKALDAFSKVALSGSGKSGKLEKEVLLLADKEYPLCVKSGETAKKVTIECKGKDVSKKIIEAAVSIASTNTEQYCKDEKECATSTSKKCMDRLLNK